MRLVRTAGLLLAVTAAAVAGEPQTTVTVKDVPPEAIPAGTCKESAAGYLGVTRKGTTREVGLTDKQIGEYVRVRMSQGYSVALYPQASGKIFTIETCESVKH